MARDPVFLSSHPIELDGFFQTIKVISTIFIYSKSNILWPTKVVQASSDLHTNYSNILSV